MTALRLQTGGRHQASPASFGGGVGGGGAQKIGRTAEYDVDTDERKLG